ncbi:MAG: SPOR domain-containing protein [Spirochaetaceae bacterium]|jgi:DedD protein|nr:SPOR domain-containing protein [Spirochaetaceae bacterium]
MEKKKLLLVSVSVGLFLVIVIGASILVFSPRNYPSVTKSEIVPVMPGEPRVSVGAPPVIVPPAPVFTETGTGTLSVEGEDNKTLAAGEQRTLENVIYINGDNAENAVRVERLSDGNTRTIITIPSPSENIITVTPPPSQQSSDPADVSVSTKTASVVAVKPETPSPTTTNTQKTVAAAPSVGTRTEKAPSTRPAWWVQTNSYSKKSYADSAKKFLESKGITSVVMNGVVGGKTFYRVRVGPYSSQAEANYWLSLIKTIEGMENSLVWQSSSL